MSDPATPFQDDGRISTSCTPTPWGEIFVRVAAPAGRGTPPVVLVHGFVISSRYWEPLISVLSRHAPVYAPDLPGFGGSEKPPHTLGLLELADALNGWMEAAGLGCVNMIGSSFGCQIAAELARRHPAAVRRLVLQGPTVDPRARSLARQLWRLVKNSRIESPALGGIAKTDYRKAGFRRIVGTLRVMLRGRIEEALPGVQAPTLVLAGRRDPVAPPDWAEQVARLLPRGRLIVVEGAGHTMNVTMPERFAEAVLPFLAGESGHASGGDRDAAAHGRSGRS